MTTIQFHGKYMAGVGHEQMTVDSDISSSLAVGKLLRFNSMRRVMKVPVKLIVTNF